MQRRTNTKVKVIIWGAGGHAKVVGETLRLMGGWEIFGFLDDISPERWGKQFCGSQILGGSDILPPQHTAGITNLALGVGDCKARLGMAALCRRLGFSLVTAIHPRSTVSPEATVGEGTVIVAGAVVNPSAKLGCAVIVNTCASIDHDCTIGDGVHIGPGAHLAGQVEVGECAWVGLGALVREGCRIGNGAYVGAGAVVLDDVPAGVLAYGVPAKVVRQL